MERQFGRVIDNERAVAIHIDVIVTVHARNLIVQVDLDQAGRRLGHIQRHAENQRHGHQGKGPRRTRVRNTRLTVVRSDHIVVLCIREQAGFHVRSWDDSGVGVGRGTGGRVLNGNVRKRPVISELHRGRRGGSYTVILEKRGPGLQRRQRRDRVRGRGSMGGHIGQRENRTRDIGGGHVRRGSGRRVPVVGGHYQSIRRVGIQAGIGQHPLGQGQVGTRRRHLPIQGDMMILSRQRQHDLAAGLGRQYHAGQRGIGIGLGGHDRARIARRQRIRDRLKLVKRARGQSGHRNHRRGNGHVLVAINVGTALIHDLLVRLRVGDDHVIKRAVQDEIERISGQRRRIHLEHREQRQGTNRQLMCVRHGIAGHVNQVVRHHIVRIGERVRIQTNVRERKIRRLGNLHPVALDDHIAVGSGEIQRHRRGGQIGVLNRTQRRQRVI